ncbi:MAG: peptidase C1A papain [Bacteroidetes bacterium]|nr:peptidase C1A papain [Bacteroidota bacterium]
MPPIRMVDDPNDDSNNSGDDSGGGGGFSGGGGGGGGLFGIILALLGLFRGRGLIFLLIILAGGYFLFGRTGCGAGIAHQVAQGLATGGFLDPKQFEKANIYESLSDDSTKNPLPEAVNLQKYAPGVGDQGHQGSCVAWSSAYGARTIAEAARTGQDPNTLKYSPSFLYNQIGLEGCEGSYIERAMEFMTQSGSVPYDDFPYDDKDCSRQPDQRLLEMARQNKMRGFVRLTPGDRNNAIDLRAIRENLSQGAPVVIGMMVGGSYMQPMFGQDLWTPTDEDRQMIGFGGHAQCVVGYDDRKYGGAFLIMNSWGPKWGNNGFAWVRYPDFKFFVREAYGLEPMTKTGAAAAAPFSCEIGLVQVHYEGKKTVTDSYIPLQVKNGNVFETISPVKKGTRFKMEVRNTTECYVYVFGKETDGTSYTLFPYPRSDNPSKTKYSPFCGITGYRLFPKDKSMMPDSIGTRDQIAVVVSRSPLNWYSINDKISQNPGQDYASRLNAALDDQVVKNVKFKSSAKGNMQFTVEGDPGTNGVVATIVEISKQ